MKLNLSKMNGVKRYPAQPKTFATTPVSPYSKWTKYAIPTDNQGQYPSCVGHATANWVEQMVRFTHGKNAIPAGKQVDGKAIWLKARGMFWQAEPLEAGGLYPDQGFKAAVEMGILPPSSLVGAVSFDVGMLSRMLREEPVIQGTAVHKGWENPDKVNGQIPVAMPNPNAGHATVIIGVLVQDGEPYVLFQNSWGSGWGMGGYGLLRADQWEQCLLGPLAVCKTDLSDWYGWRDWLV